MKRFTVAVVCLSGCVLGSACQAIVGIEDRVEAPPVDGNVVEGGPNSKELGVPCGAGTECASTFCVDGVCCEATCSGTCEACNVAGSIGRCAPVPSGQDPEQECKALPRDPVDEAGVDAGGDAGAGDGGDAGVVFSFPDGGALLQDDKACAPSCNGQRACAYPATEKTCGTVFCGNASTQGRAQCDGKGHCLFGAEDCKAFSCPDGSQGCKSTCAGEADCATGHYCDATTNSCKPRVPNGSACKTGLQCASGYCVDDVCCNDSCEIASGTCTKPGFVGKCVCSACPDGTCGLWYIDRDKDTYGDLYGTTANGGAMYGCVGGPAPATGFVENNTDCYDKNDAVGAKIHPKQPEWFAESYIPILGGNPSWDYNCDGARQAEVPEAFGSVAGSTCGVCAPSQGMVVGCTKYSVCTANDVTIAKPGVIDCHPVGFMNQCGGSTFGFLATVGCGQSATQYVCGSCYAQGVAPGFTQGPRTQRCH